MFLVIKSLFPLPVSSPGQAKACVHVSRGIYSSSSPSSSPSRLIFFALWPTGFSFSLAFFLVSVFFFFCSRLSEKKSLGIASHQLALMEQRIGIWSCKLPPRTREWDMTNVGGKGRPHVQPLKSIEMKENLFQRVIRPFLLLLLPCPWVSDSTAEEGWEYATIPCVFLSVVSVSASWLPRWGRARQQPLWEVGELRQYTKRKKKERIGNGRLAGFRW